MRMIAGFLIVFALVFGLAGPFVSYPLSINSHSVPVWLLIEVIALSMLIAGIAIRIRVGRL